MLNTQTLRWQRKYKLLSQNSPVPTEDQFSTEEQAFIFPAVVLYVCISLAGIVLMFRGCDVAHASETVDNQKAIYAIIGEAENQGHIGMLAVAHAIRNRGTLQGVYGLHAPRVKHHLYSQGIYAMAKQAWEQSAFDYDITHGATNWEDIKAFGCPKWVKGCVEVFRYKDHVFYKEI